MLLVNYHSSPFSPLAFLIYVLLVFSSPLVHLSPLWCSSSSTYQCLLSSFLFALAYFLICWCFNSYVASWQSLFMCHYMFFCLSFFFLIVFFACFASFFFLGKFFIYVAFNWNVHVLQCSSFLLHFVEVMHHCFVTLCCSTLDVFFVFFFTFCFPFVVE